MLVSLRRSAARRPPAPVAVRVEGLGKAFPADDVDGRFPTLYGRVARLLGRRGVGASAEPRWALRDVGFELRRGGVLGVVGCNGSGKSTLLRLLARTTAPTEGRIRIHGRVGALLDLGSGFHPELTGRENIRVGAAILGMGASELAAVEEDIVAFADIGRHMDRPVKAYSSGMHLRLAFSIAAHLNTDIMLLDEVLAVGDQPFQEKCAARIQAICREGRTVVMVSHVVPHLRGLCDTLLVLDGGRSVFLGPAAVGLDYYLREVLPGRAEPPGFRAGAGPGARTAG